MAESNQKKSRNVQMVLLDPGPSNPKINSGRSSQIIVPAEFSAANVRRSDQSRRKQGQNFSMRHNCNRTPAREVTTSSIR
jgi:hypothetical protein